MISSYIFFKILIFSLFPVKVQCRYVITMLQWLFKVSLGFIVFMKSIFMYCKRKGLLIEFAGESIIVLRSTPKSNAKQRRISNSEFKISKELIGSKKIEVLLGGIKLSFCKSYIFMGS